MNKIVTNYLSLLALLLFTGLTNAHADTAIDEAFKKLIDSKEPQTFWLTSKGIDQEERVVSTFEFEWTLLLKN